MTLAEIFKKGPRATWWLTSRRVIGPWQLLALLDSGRLRWVSALSVDIVRPARRARS